MEKLYRSQKKSPVPTPVLKSHKSPNENLIFAPSQSKKRLVKSKNPSYTASPVETPKGSNLNMGQKQFLNFKPLHVRQNSESQVKVYEKFDKLTSANKQENTSKNKNTTKSNQIVRKLTVQNPIALPRPPTTKKHQTKGVSNQKDQESQNFQQKKDSSKVIQHNRVNSYNGINGITSTINPVLSSRRQSRQNSSSQLRLSQDLNVVQGVSYKSKTGMIPGSVPKVNQDSYIIQNFFSKSLTQHFYAVADGHGICGHDVSQYVKARLPAILQNEQDLKGNPAKALRNSILQVSNELMRQQFDVQFSGTTLVSVLIQGRKLWCANVGDSRAVLVKENSAIPLNRDHKPELEDEAQRIYDCNGRIMAYKGNFEINVSDEDGSDIGPLRVWIKEADIPGLAMTRSLGDLVAQSVGVSPDPEIMEFQLQTSDKFIIIASDGVWEFLSNEHAAQIVKDYVENGQLQQACDLLVREANKKWTEVSQQYKGRRSNR